MTPLPNEIEPALAAALASCPDVPLRVCPGGAVRVGKTRVNLDTVLEEHGRGSTPEEIVRAYDVLRVEDVLAVLAFYGQHRPEVDEYLTRREAEARRLYEEITALQAARRNARPLPR